MAKVHTDNHGNNVAKWGVIEWIASSAIFLVIGAGGGALSAKDAKQDERITVVETRQEMNEELLGEVRKIVPIMQRLDFHLQSLQKQLDDIRDTP